MQMISTATWILWNVFLAFIPVALAYAIVWMTHRWKKQRLLKGPIILLLFAWLVFLPNTCYLLTEWRHFLINLDSSNLYLQAQIDSNATVRLMIYTIYYFCYSAVGMLAFTLAIRPVARLVKEDGAALWIYAVPLFILLSMGVYLGLVLRFNSWDLATRPSLVWGSIVAALTRPKLAALIVAFAGVLWIAYTAIDIWIDGFLTRVRK